MLPPSGNNQPTPFPNPAFKVAALQVHSTAAGTWKSYEQAMKKFCLEGKGVYVEVTRCSQNQLDSILQILRIVS